MGKRRSNNFFLSTLGKRVVATQLTPTSALPLHPERQAIYSVSEEEDEWEPALLALKRVSD